MTLFQCPKRLVAGRVWPVSAADIATLAAVIIALVAFTPASAQVVIPAPPRLNCIFGLGGQSNGVGLAPIPSPGIRVSDRPKRTFLFTLGNKWAQGAFDPAHTTDAKWGGSAYSKAFPANHYAGEGMGVYFLDRWIASHKDHFVALIPMARSGTEISLHMPNTSLLSIYGAGRDRLIRAKQYGSLCGIIFVQGEADTKDLAKARDWLNKFIIIAQAWRSDHGANLPIVLVALSNNSPDDTKYPYWSVVRKLQYKTRTTIPNLVIVGTDDLAKLAKGDPHYTADSYKTIGERAATALTKLIR